MTQEQELGALARSIIGTNRFMALGTADASGTPWVSPVWYAPLSSHEYVWASRPGRDTPATSPNDRRSR
jgi:hypothetical protein